MRFIEDDDRRFGHFLGNNFGDFRIQQIMVTVHDYIGVGDLRSNTINLERERKTRVLVITVYLARK